MLTKCPLTQSRVSANGRVGATAAVYTAAILGAFASLFESVRQISDSSNFLQST